MRWSIRISRKDPALGTRRAASVNLGAGLDTRQRILRSPTGPIYVSPTRDPEYGHDSAGIIDGGPLVGPPTFNGYCSADGLLVERGSMGIVTASSRDADPRGGHAANWMRGLRRLASSRRRRIADYRVRKA